MTGRLPRPTGVRRYVPACAGCRDYQARDLLRYDVIAGATVWGLLVPESIAYAGLAGLPPQAGLYTLLATLAAYAIFGTSRHLVAAGDLRGGGAARRRRSPRSASNLRRRTTPPTPRCS